MIIKDFASSIQSWWTIAAAVLTMFAVTVTTYANLQSTIVEMKHKTEEFKAKTEKYQTTIDDINARLYRIEGALGVKPK